MTDGGDGSSCKVTAACPISNCSICCGCDELLRPVLPDLCGKCEGDNSTCQGCDRVPFSGRLTDQCGVCGGDGSTCTGCDGGVHSEKVRDLCGVCEGGNSNRDVCGVCVTDIQWQVLLVLGVMVFLSGLLELKYVRLYFLCPGCIHSLLPFLFVLGPHLF